MASVALPIALGGLSFLSGLFGNKQNQQQTTTSSLNPALNPLQAQLMRILQSRLSGSGGGDYAGMTNRRIAGVNQAYRGASTALQNKLRAAGLGTSNVAGGAEANLEQARAGDIGGLIAEEPLLARQDQTAAINSALGLLGQGRGSTTTGTGTTGGGIGGGLTDVGGILGFLYGSGALGGGAKKLGAQPAGVRI